jgi:hypothetical protein
MSWLFQWHVSLTSWVWFMYFLFIYLKRLSKIFLPDFLRSVQWLKFPFYILCLIMKLIQMKRVPGLFWTTGTISRFHFNHTRTWDYSLMEALFRLRVWWTGNTSTHQLLESCLRVSHIIILYWDKICLWCWLCLHTLNNQTQWNGHWATNNDQKVKHSMRFC